MSDIPGNDKEWIEDQWSERFVEEEEMMDAEEDEFLLQYPAEAEAMVPSHMVSSRMYPRGAGSSLVPLNIDFSPIVLLN